MFEKQFISNAIRRSAETELDRRKLFTMAGVAGVGAAAALSGGALPASAATRSMVSSAAAPSEASVLNFALNLEYLEAEFYLRAATGEGLPDNMVGGSGTVGAVSGGRKVKFKNGVIAKYAQEIAKDEKEHVAFLRGALGESAVARPKISLDAAFTAAARAAGLITSKQSFDPYASDLNFLFAAFIFEDVGVTAYKGAAGFLSTPAYLDAAAGILGVEAYHAGIVRSTLYAMGAGSETNHGIWTAVNKISDARDSLDGSSDDDQGIRVSGNANLVPTDSNAIAYSRTTGQVLNVVYLNPASVTKGGFYPDGVNGSINTSDNNS